MKYQEIVKEAQNARKKAYGNGQVQFAPCETWLEGDQINLWTYWQGYQLKDIDEKGVDILLVGQDWGNPSAKKNADMMERIKKIQSGGGTIRYDEKASPTDKNMAKMFKSFGDNIDILNDNPGMRLFFTNYSLGYRTDSESGGMTKELMKKDKQFFDDLVLAIKPKIIICLGQLTYEMVSGQKTDGFCERLKEGKPFEAAFPLKQDVKVYGVAHCGSRGRQNVGGIENMQKAWNYIAKEYFELIKPTSDSHEAVGKPFTMKKTDGIAISFENGEDGQVLITRSNRPNETVIMSADMICKCLGI